MVKDLDKLETALFPKITELNKWVLAIHKSDSDKIILNIMNATTISCVKDFQYVITYTESYLSSYDGGYCIDYYNPYYEGIDNTFFDERTNLFVADNKEEIFDFLHNAIHIHEFLDIHYGKS